MEASILLRSDPTSAYAARNFVADTLEAWGVGLYVMETAVLLASELVANAIVHARTPIVVGIDSTNDHLKIAVKDNSAQLPTRRLCADELARGRGLQLVDVMANRWGSSHDGCGKTVWLELPSGH